MDTIEKALLMANKLRKDYHPITLLSENKKTCVSINLPIKGHCKPTKRCLKDCYAKCGHTALDSNKKKQQFLSDYLLRTDLDLLIFECKRYVSVRLNGTGDLKPGHLPGLLSLAKAASQTTFWGMTRKPDIAAAVNGVLPNLSLLVSVDPTTPASVWNYPGKLCFGPRRPEDVVPDDDRIITIFPRHHAGRIIGDVPVDPKDCPAVRHEVNGCIECKKCWNV